MLLWFPAIFARPIVAKVAWLYPLGQSPQPYFQPAHALLLYFALPVVVLSGFVLLLSPGALIVLAIGQGARWCEFVIRTFGATVVLVVTATTLAKAALPSPLSAQAFVGLLLAANLVSWLWLYVRVWRGAQITWPAASRADRRHMVAMASAVLASVILLLPKLFWENFSGDGHEMHHFGSSLFRYALPTFVFSTHSVGVDPQWMLPMYAVNWALGLFGPVEGAGRLPFLLWLPLLFAVVVALAELMSPRPMGPKEEACLWVAIATFGVTVTYNATYNPWFADIAAPAGNDSLLPVVVLAALLFLWSERLGWFALFGFLSYFVRPTAVWILLSFGVLGFFIDRERKWRRLGMILGLAFASMLVGAFLQSYTTSPGGLMYTSEKLLSRLRFIRLDDFGRIAYLVFPGGVLPALACVMWRWQDPLSRLVAATTATYFLCFYAIAFVALHHFIPVMVLPLVVFWRVYLRQSDAVRRPVLMAATGLALIAFWLSLPNHFRITNSERELAQMVEYRVENRAAPFPEGEPTAEGLLCLFSVVWAGDPSKEWGIEQGVILHYTLKPKPPGAVVNYVVQPATLAPPPGFTLVGSRRTLVCYVRDLAAWHARKVPSMPANFRSRLYAVPPEVLSRQIGLGANLPLIDLKEWWSRIVAFWRRAA